MGKGIATWRQSVAVLAFGGPELSVLFEGVQNHGLRAVQTVRADEPTGVLFALDDEHARHRALQQRADFPHVALVAVCMNASPRSLQLLAACGADDIIYLPERADVATSRVEAAARLTLCEFEQRRAQKAHALKLAEWERTDAFVQETFERIQHGFDTGRAQRSGQEDNHAIQLSVTRPDGGHVVAMLDLPARDARAAYLALAVHDAVRLNTQRGLALPDILKATHKAVATLAPEHGCQVAFAEISPDGHLASVWRTSNGPAVLQINHVSGRRTCTLLPAAQDALGNEPLRARATGVELAVDAELLLLSPRVHSLHNPRLDMDGTAAFAALLAELDGSVRAIADDIFASAHACRHGPAAVSTIVVGPAQDRRFGSKPVQGDWSFSLQVNAASLRISDPLTVVLDAISGLAHLAPHRGRIFTVLSELYTNAVDHGLLGLSSKLKQGPDGFVRYYSERADRLEALEDGFVRFDVRIDTVDSGEHALVVRLTDSGDGFVPSAASDQPDADTDALDRASVYSGRGVDLVRSLCRSVEYLGCGNAVEIVYVDGKGAQAVAPEQPAQLRLA